VTLPEGFTDGLLLVDKVAGETSHDVVARARRAFGVRRIGHTGTLDPFATGLLILCIGRATRIAEYLHAFPKSYRATARLGQVTSTLDPEGDVIAEDPGWRELETEAIGRAIGSLVGVQDQRPPDFSAKKLDGEAAYLRARRGEVVEIEPVSVHVHSMTLDQVDLPRIEFSAVVSTGTYIRSLARDLGDILGVGAHLTALRRVSIGPFHVKDAVQSSDLESAGNVSRAWVDPLTALAHLPRHDVGPDEARRLRSGQRLDIDQGGFPRGEPVVVAEGRRLVAIAFPEAGQLRPRKVFSEE
jgi:tRNA pseudouridine55 synthase